MLSWTTHDVEGVLVVTLEPSPAGDDHRHSQDRQPLYEAIQTRSDGRFIVDLRGIDFVSSADIGFLISIRRRADARSPKGKVVLINVHPYIQNSLETMKLLPLFPIAEDLAGAFQLLPAESG